MTQSVPQSEFLQELIRVIGSPSAETDFWTVDPATVEVRLIAEIAWRRTLPSNIGLEMLQRLAAERAQSAGAAGGHAPA